MYCYLVNGLHINYDAVLAVIFSKLEVKKIIKFTISFIFHVSAKEKILGKGHTWN